MLRDFPIATPLRKQFDAEHLRPDELEDDTEPDFQQVARNVLANARAVEPPTSTLGIDQATTYRTGEADSA